MGAILQAHVKKFYDSKSRRNKCLVWLTKLCGDSHKADDILSDKLTYLYSSDRTDPEYIESDEDFDRYLYTSLRRECSRQRKNSEVERNLRLIILKKLEKEQADLANKFFQDDTTLLKTIMDSLNGIDRRILEDFYLHGLSCMDIAEAFDEEGIRPKRVDADRFTADSVRQQKFRIIKKLKEKWTATIE